MILWTIQPVEVYNLIQKQGYYVCNSDKSSMLNCGDNDIDGGNKKAYDWLVKKMKEKVGKPPKDVKYPVWAWHTDDWKHKIPDLADGTHGIPGREYVCMEIEIPDDQVVLTEFDKWHYVLNDSFANLEEDDKEWENKWEWFDSLSHEEQEKVKEESWEVIFDITKVDNGKNWNGRWVQATFWKLDKSQIREVIPFVEVQFKYDEE